MLKGNLFDLKIAAGDSSDTRAGCGEGQSHPLKSAEWIEKILSKNLFMENKVESGLN